MSNTVKLKDVCEFKRGLTYSKRDEVDYSNNVVVRATNIDLKNNKLNLAQLKYIKESIKINEDKILKKGDILICTASGSKSHLGKVALVDKDIKMAFGGFMGVLRTSEKCLPKFLYNILVSQKFKKVLLSNTSGANINNLRFSQIENFEFILPPLQEQQRIVAKLAAAFAEIDKISHSDVLNNKNREKILTNYLLKIFSNNRTEKEYELGEICKIVGGGTPSKSNPMFYEGEIPWATVRDMKKDIIQNTQYKINKEAIIKSSTNIIPKENVVIATRVGLGKVCILKNDTAINQDLKGIIPIKSKMVDINFLFYWFKSISKIIKNHGTGLTVQGVKLPFIKSLKINLPPIKEQKIIAEKIYALQSNLDAVKIIKDKRNYNLNCLRSSLLRSILNKNKAA